MTSFIMKGDILTMSKNNNFDVSTSDLGTSFDIGLDRAEVSNQLLYSANEIPTQCYACTAPNPAYQILPLKPAYDTAQLQNGLYVCNHCMRQGIVDKSRYGLRELK